MKKLLYIAAGSEKWGIGHLKRSAELVEVLRERGVILHSVALLPHIDKPFKLRAEVIDDFDECVSSLDGLNDNECQGIIVDVHTDLQPSMNDWLEGHGHPVCAIDWYHEMSGCIRAVANLRGGADALRYAIVRREFRECRRHDLQPEYVYDAVVVVGGGDRRGCLSAICENLNDIAFVDKKIVVVVGPSVDESTRQLLYLACPHITVLQGPDDIAKIMANAMVGLTNGGTSLMEFTMLGVPTLIFPQSEQEDNFIKPFVDAGCGKAGILEQKGFVDQLVGLWENADLRKDMSLSGRSMIDGQGVDRIADMVCDVFQ